MYVCMSVCVCMCVWGKDGTWKVDIHDMAQARGKKVSISRLCHLGLFVIVIFTHKQIEYLQPEGSVFKKVRQTLY